MILIEQDLKFYIKKDTQKTGDRGNVSHQKA